jgi:hypothetical protein
LLPCLPLLIAFQVLQDKRFKNRELQVVSTAMFRRPPQPRIKTFPDYEDVASSERCSAKALFLQQ